MRGDKPDIYIAFISHSVFYWKIHLVLDGDTFRLEVDYGQSQSRCHLIKRELHFMAQ